VLVSKPGVNGVSTSRQARSSVVLCRQSRITMTNSHDSQESAHLEKLRSQISTDIEDMQQKETSLREYEQRLRLLVEHAHNSRPPQTANQFYSNTTPTSSSVDMEWEKYRRAHALLEAARRGLCDDRLAVKDREEKLQLREEEVTRREVWVKVREQELETLTQARIAQQAVVPKPKTSFTAAPFIAARNLLMRNSSS
jgi:hypothetical protein